MLKCHRGQHRKVEGGAQGEAKPENCRTSGETGAAQVRSVERAGWHGMGPGAAAAAAVAAGRLTLQACRRLLGTAASSQRTAAIKRQQPADLPLLHCCCCCCCCRRRRCLPLAQRK